MEFTDFKEYLLLFSRDVNEEMNEFVWKEGERKVSEWLVSILEDWEEIAKSLPRKQHNALLWRIGSNPLFVGFWLEDSSSLSLDEKSAILRAAKCVTLSIPSLFAPDEPMENGYFMWWELLSKTISDPEVASVCLEILDDLSKHPDERIQYAALHGLGHLNHPGRTTVVDAYIRRHPDLKGDIWLQQCRDGTVM